MGTPPALIESDALVYHHEGRERAALAACSLRIERGERILLEGPSGSGKSTLAALLAGLRHPTSGQLRLDGTEQSSVGRAAWRRHVVAAPQFHENHVVLGPLVFNLLMGRRWPPEPKDLQDAHELCLALGLGPIVERMPGGLQQMVGDTGWQLSHGERSLVFLGRALLQGCRARAPRGRRSALWTPRPWAAPSAWPLKERRPCWSSGSDPPPGSLPRRSPTGFCTSHLPTPEVAFVQVSNDANQI